MTGLDPQPSWTKARTVHMISVLDPKLSWTKTCTVQIMYGLYPSCMDQDITIHRVTELDQKLSFAVYLGLGLDPNQTLN
jgi:hypothetical protein